MQYLEKLFEDYLKVANPQGLIYCFLDEIQFFDRWPIFIKAHFEQKNVKFIITGSNSYLMSHELLTLLSGRTLPLEVFPFSFKELAQLKFKDPLSLLANSPRVRSLLDNYIQYGGFPEIVLMEDKKLAPEILSQYSVTILYQDVARRLNLKKPLDLERLYYYLASHIGSFFSYAGLAELFALTDKTVKEYIHALIGANLLFEVDKFSFSLKTQFRSHKKIYSIDTGMTNAIAFKFTENHGKLFENAIFLELKRRRHEVYYYKTHSGFEVDFLIKDQKKLQLIQVCSELHPEAEKREIRALIQAAEELKLKEGLIITADTEKEWTVEGMKLCAIPLYKFLFNPL